jgi:hypothetical protein
MPIHTDDVRVYMLEHVAAAIREDIAGSPGVEVGGKFIGRVLRGPPIAAVDGPERTQRIDIIVLDYLDGGPQISSGPTHYLPDGEYQEALFRVVEAADPEVEHIGTWHSHHPNRCKWFSSGDLDGYRETISSPDYRPECFLATLAVDESGLSGASHIVWFKGASQPERISAEHITILAEPGPYVPVLAQGRRDIRARLQASRSPALGSSAAEPPAPWWCTALGKAVLVHDRRMIEDLLGPVKATAGRSGDYLAILARTSFKGVAVSIRYEFASRGQRAPISIAAKWGGFGDRQMLSAEIRGDEGARRARVISFLQRVDTAVANSVSAI